jgi:hypothetical protein
MCLDELYAMVHFISSFEILLFGDSGFFFSLTPAKHRFTKTYGIMLVDPLYLRDNYV